MYVHFQYGGATFRLKTGITPDDIVTALKDNGDRLALKRCIWDDGDDDELTICDAYFEGIFQLYYHDQVESQPFNGDLIISSQYSYPHLWYIICYISNEKEWSARYF